MRLRPAASAFRANLPRTAGRWATLGFATLLVACSTPTAFERPQGDLPTAWTTPGLPSSSASPATVPSTSLPWQAYFTDPRLQALISLALENNRDLRIAAGKVEQDRAIYRITSADRLPTVNLQVDQTRSYTSASALENSASSRRIDIQGLLSWELDFWGRVSSLSESARANFLATEHARREVYLSLIAEVARVYFALLEKDDQIDLATSVLRTREQTLEIATQGERLGGADEDERQQAMVGVESAKSSLAQLQHERNMAVNQLNFLVGRVADDLPPGRPLADQEPGALALVPGLPSEVLLRRPDVMAAEQRLRAANADIDAARAAFLPKIMLTAALGLASPALAGLFSGGAWSYQPVMSLPIFDGGRTAANADVAQARKVVAVAEYEKTLQQAFREVADQLSARTAVQAQLASALVGQRALSERLKMARGRYEIGLSSYREVLEAQRGLLTARQSTIALRRQQQDAAATLYKVLGSGAEAAAVTLAAAPPLITPSTSPLPLPLPWPWPWAQAKAQPSTSAPAQASTPTPTSAQIPARAPVPALTSAQTQARAQAWP